MTVQKMIDELNKLTDEEKALPITMNVCDRDGSEENVEIDDFCVCNKCGWVNNNTIESRKVVLVME